MSLLPVPPLGAVRLAHKKSKVKGSVCKKFLKSLSVAKRVQKLFIDTPLLWIAETDGDRLTRGCRGNACPNVILLRSDKITIGLLTLSATLDKVNQMCYTEKEKGGGLIAKNN